MSQHLFRQSITNTNFPLALLNQVSQQLKQFSNYQVPCQLQHVRHVRLHSPDTANKVDVQQAAEKVQLDTSESVYFKRVPNVLQLQTMNILHLPRALVARYIQHFGSTLKSDDWVLRHPPSGAHWPVVCCVHTTTKGGGGVLQPVYGLSSNLIGFIRGVGVEDGDTLRLHWKPEEAKVVNVHVMQPSVTVVYDLGEGGGGDVEDVGGEGGAQQLLTQQDGAELADTDADGFVQADESLTTHTRSRKKFKLHITRTSHAYRFWLPHPVSRQLRLEPDTVVKLRYKNRFYRVVLVIDHGQVAFGGAWQDFVKDEGLLGCEVVIWRDVEQHNTLQVCQINRVELVEKV